MFESRSDVGNECTVRLDGQVGDDANGGRPSPLPAASAQLYNPDRSVAFREHPVPISPRGANASTNTYTKRRARIGRVFLSVPSKEKVVIRIIYIVGAVVIVLALLSFLGLR